LSDARGPEFLAPRLAASIMIVVLLGFLVIQFVNIVALHLGPGRVATAAVLLVLLLALQIVHSIRPVRRPLTGVSAVTLAIQAVLTFVPLLWFSLNGWGGMSALLIASALLLLPSPMSWLVPVGISIALGSGSLVSGQGWANTAYLELLNILTGLGLYALAWLAEVVTRLHGTRTELARLAVAEERLRFSRDLHDLLGYSLSAITLKGELAYRLIGTDTEQVQDSVDTVVKISRQALADVRAVARSYRDLSLDVEVVSALSVLEAAGIAATVEVTVGAVPRELDTVLATVIREGVTNLLRHSTATECRIVAGRDGGQVRLVLENDGVPCCPQLAEPGQVGGLDNLRARLAGIGGELSVSCRDGWFRVDAAAALTRTG
jgi:two-component system sensor histidine kinase DesK